MAKLKEWHRLDNSGKIYPFNLKNNIQNLFRISAVMNAPVDAVLLSSAVEASLKRYPFFNVCLRRGIFWHYLEELDGKPDVAEDSDILIRDIDTIQTYGFNFRFSYYKNKIALDCFHALCDGNGAMEFFKTVLLEYLRLSGESIPGGDVVNEPQSQPLPEESEDGFLKYAQKVKLTKLEGIDELRGEKAFTFDGPRFDYKGSGVIEGAVDTASLLARARERNTTVTAYLGGALIWAVYKSQIEGKSENKLPVVLFIPINLRRIFPSKTLLNFSLFSRVGVHTGKEVTVDEIIERVAERLKKDTDKATLQNKINVTAKTERFWLFRLMPLPVKQIIYLASGAFFGKNKKTMTFSNMGVVKLPTEMEGHIKEISIMASTSKTAPEVMTAVTALGKTTMTFARRIVDTGVEREFFRFLATEGLDVTVRGNYWEA